mgnify:FL=1|jgi:hypothetical protein
MLRSETVCKAKATKKEKVALMRDAKLEVAYNLISEVQQEVAADDYPGWTEKTGEILNAVEDCSMTILRQIIWLSHKLEELNK